MKKFEQTLKKYSLIKEGDTILVGVSGGPDSMALLLLLNKLKSKLNISLHIAHIDHGMRKDSALDAQFVKKWAEKLKIPVSIKKLGPELLKEKGSLEENFRKARLDYLITTAKKIKAKKIALGHNLDDQAETVLMRLLRGTGLSGLSGISLKRKMGGVTFIRPLLETARKDIEKFLKRRGVKPRIDLSNKDEAFFRNKIRHKLIPLLKKGYNRNITEVLANLAESASFDYEYLDTAAKKSLKGNNLKLNISKLMKLHPAILRLKIRQSIACLQGDIRRIIFQHIKEIENMLHDRPVGSIVNLPKGIHVKKSKKHLQFYLKNTA